MARQIVLIAREFLAPGTALDAQTSRFVEIQRELHAEVNSELQKYGSVSKQRTSGVFARVNTPAHGVRLADIEVPTILSDPESHPSTQYALDNRKKEIPTFFRNLLPMIQQSNCVVIVRDGQNDLRGAIAMYVHILGLPMLALQHEPRGIHLPGDPLYELPNIVNIRFQHFSEAKLGIARFMNNIPNRSHAVG